MDADKHHEVKENDVLCTILHIRVFLLLSLKTEAFKNIFTRVGRRHIGIYNTTLVNTKKERRYNSQTGSNRFKATGVQNVCIF